MSDKLSDITDKIAHEWADRNNLRGNPVDTLRLAIEDARSIPELAEDFDATDPCGGSAPIAWQRRYLDFDGKWSRWVEHLEDARPKKIGRWKCEYRPLFTKEYRRA